MKTKIILSMLASYFYSNATFSQLEKAEDKTWQMGLSINSVESATDAGFDYNALSQRIFTGGHKNDKSFCIGFNGLYKMNENYLWRFSIKQVNYRVSEILDHREIQPSPSFTEYSILSAEITRHDYIVATGILLPFSFFKLNPYMGGEIFYKKYGTANGNTTWSIYDKSNNNINDEFKFDSDYAGGYSFGLSPLVGFNINIYKNVVVGTEFSSALTYFKTGGRITTTRTIVHNLNPSAVGTKEESASEQTYTALKFSKITSSLIISIKF